MEGSTGLPTGGGDTYQSPEFRLDLARALANRYVFTRPDLQARYHRENGGRTAIEAHRNHAVNRNKPRLNRGKPGLNRGKPGLNGEKPGLNRGKAGA